MKASELKVRLDELQVRSKKSFGQNFLINDAVIQKIIDSVAAVGPAFLLEIGPGLGALTERLSAFRPMLIELDRDLAEHWRKRGFEVIEEDALRVHWERLPLPENSWLVSNLPYQISTSLLVDRCFGPAQLCGMILMFQKEVAARLVAQPRTSAYGMLSVMAQLYWDITKIADASPRDFHPAPKVASRVLKFVRKAGAPDRGFLGFIKTAFGHRRKFLLKNLSQLGHKLAWEAVLPEMGISPKVRAEELNPQQFVELYRHWKMK